jgi:hypothetical protein
MPAPSRSSEPSVPNFRSYPLLPAPLALPQMQAPIPDMNGNIVQYQPPSAQQNPSQITNVSQSAASDVLARLRALLIKEVEATLSNQYRKSDPDCSLLAYLRAPGDGITQAQAAALVLEELADGIEDVSTTTSLVVRYVQAHRLWADHPNPAVNSLETLLGTIDGIQYVQAGTVIGTSSQLMRARAIRLIEKHWGADWFLKIPADMKDPAWSTAADCSHQLLRLIAANAKQGIDLEMAKSAWAQSIHRRRDERVRKELRMRCPRFPFIITDDVRSLSQTLGLSQQDRRTSEIVYPDEPAEDQLRVELVTPGSKRSAPFAQEFSANKSAQRKRQKRRQQDSRVDHPTHELPDHGDGWRVTNDGRWKQRRNGNQIIRVPLADCDGSHPRTELLSAESRAGTPHVADGTVRSSARSADRVLCNGPSIAADLRRIIGTLALGGKDGSASSKLAGCCCTPCRSKIDILDEMINGTIQVATALEELTDHQISSGDSQHSDSVPSTPQLPRQYRWWLPIDDETDGE